MGVPHDDALEKCLDLCKQISKSACDIRIVLEAAEPPEPEVGRTLPIRAYSNDRLMGNADALVSAADGLRRRLEMVIARI